MRRPRPSSDDEDDVDDEIERLTAHPSARDDAKRRKRQHRMLSRLMSGGRAGRCDKDPAAGDTVVNPTYAAPSTATRKPPPQTISPEPECPFETRRKEQMLQEGDDARRTPRDRANEGFRLVDMRQLGTFLREKTTCAKCRELDLARCLIAYAEEDPTSAASHRMRRFATEWTKDHPASTIEFQKERSEGLCACFDGVCDEGHGVKFETSAMHHQGRSEIREVNL